MEIKGVMGGIYRLCEWIMLLAYANILWIGFTIVGGVAFGLFPATVALFSIIRKRLYDEDVAILKTMWASFRHNFIRSNILGIILTIVGYVLWMEFNFFSSSNMLNNNMIFNFMILGAIMMYVVILLYVFPIFVHFDTKILRALYNALLIGILNPFRTVIMMFLISIIFYLFYIIPSLIPFFSISLIAIILMLSANQAFTMVEKKQNEEKEKLAN